MKRILIAVGIVAVVSATAFAVSDAAPWVKNYHQYQHMVSQKFDKEIQVAYLDAGTIATSGTFPLVKTSVLDAGVALINGQLQVSGSAIEAVTKSDVVDAGVMRVNGQLQVTGPVLLTSAVTVGNCTLNAASPAVCTDTVTAGTTCVCSLVGTTAATAAKGVACNLSSTTLTATSANGANEVVNWLCF